MSAPLALGARFRGHDENIGISYVNFCNEVLDLIHPEAFFVLRTSG
jgi:hypothetical protein